MLGGELALSQSLLHADPSASPCAGGLQPACFLPKVERGQDWAEIGSQEAVGQPGEEELDVPHGDSR